MNIRSFKQIIFGVFFVVIVFTINVLIGEYYLQSIKEAIIETQIFLITVFLILSIFEKSIISKFPSKKFALIFAFSFTRMAAVLAYLFPILLGSDKYKVELSLVFMLNYLVYFAYSTTLKVKYT